METQDNIRGKRASQLRLYDTYSFDQEEFDKVVKPFLKNKNKNKNKITK